MGVNKIRLMSNKPDKHAQLTQNGIEVVKCLPTVTFLTPHNAKYLKAKVECAGHGLQL